VLLLAWKHVAWRLLGQILGPCTNQELFFQQRRKKRNKATDPINAAKVEDKHAMCVGEL